MKSSLPLLGLGTALLLSASAAHAQLPPGVNPGAAIAAAQRAQQGDVLYWYNLLPAQIFGVFGDVNRLELLQSQGATYDKNRGFIEVFVPGDTNENDVEKIQVKLYRGNQGIMVAVSQAVWNQPRVKGALAFFALDNAGNVIDVTQRVFPYKLNEAATSQADPANAEPDGDEARTNKRGAPPINAYLSRNGTDITTGVPETNEAGPTYSWDGNLFTQADAPDEQQN